MACWARTLPEVPQLRHLYCCSGWYGNVNQNDVACAYYIVPCDLQVSIQCNTLTVITRNRPIYHTLTVSLVKISMLLAICYVLPEENTTQQNPCCRCPFTFNNLGSQNVCSSQNLANIYWEFRWIIEFLMEYWKDKFIFFTTKSLFIALFSQTLTLYFLF